MEQIACGRLLKNDISKALLEKNYKIIFKCLEMDFVHCFALLTA